MFYGIPRCVRFPSAHLSSARTVSARSEAFQCLGINARRICLGVFALLVPCLPAAAQRPQVNALFPAGAQVGETIEVSVRGGSLTGAKSILVAGAPGVSAELMGDAGKVDESTKPLFEKQCTVCHEARSPANRTMSPEQWAATVDRMIKARGANIAAPDRDKIVAYLQASARAGQVTARVTVAKDAVPGVRELRVVTDKGASTAYAFEVGALPEVMAAGASATLDQAQKITPPVVVNGTLAKSGERDYLSFETKKGQRLAFNLRGFRLNEPSQTFFNPVLYLYDAQGREIAKDLGHFGLDPLIDWTAPADGTYTVLVRDLLWRASPASVYRLTVGPLPYDGILSPEAAARPGARVPARFTASMDSGMPPGPFNVRVPDGAADGVTSVATPVGDASLLVRDLPDGGGPKGAASPAAPLPAVFHGGIVRAGQTDAFRVRARMAGGLAMYARRLGSPLRARVVVRNAKGDEIGRQDAGENDDLTFSNAFPGPGEYVVEVSDADGGGGPAYAYSWEALDGAPDFTLTATPDGANVTPGGSMPILVRVERRENLKGPIRVSALNLPEGVTASETVIPPDDDKATLIVTAAPGIAPAPRLVTVVGKAAGEGGTTAIRRARVLEEYRINGQPRLTPRASAVVAVASAAPPFTIAWKEGTDRAVLVPDKEPARIPVTVTRQKGFEGDVVVYFPTLPPGLYLESWLTIPKGQTEGALILHANGDARYLTQPRPLPDLPPMQIVAVGVLGGGDGSIITCTPPLALAGK